MLDRAQRLQRQFFTHAEVAWEPPVDIIESGETLQMHVALPGVSADAITVALDPAGITISALRAFRAAAKDRSIASRSLRPLRALHRPSRSATRTAA